MKICGFVAAPVLAMGLINSGSAAAQATAAESPWPEAASSSADIIVTAQKRSERLIDVPLSITAASGDQLISRGVTDVSQLDKITPGFSYQSSWLGAPILSIRGIGFFDNAVSASPTVTTYIDQVPLTYAVMTRGVVFDIERVEVLKGPQGTVFGQNSTGGALNFIAAKPTSTLSSGFNLDIGRFDTVNAEAFVSGPLSPTLKARVAVRRESRGDWQKGYPPNDRLLGKPDGDTLGSRDFYTGRFILDWQPTEGMNWQFGATGWKDNSDTQAPRFLQFKPTAPRDPFNGITYDLLTPLSPLPRDSRIAGWDAGKDFRRDDHFYQFSLIGNIDLNDAISLTSISAYTRYHENSRTEMDGTALSIGSVNAHANIRSYFQELRLAGNSGGLKWMIGGNYAKDKINEKQLYDLTFGTNQGIGPFRYAMSEFRNRQNVDTWAVFGSLDYDITDTLTLQGSARYTKQDRSYQGCLADPGDGAIAAGFAFAFGIPAVAGGCLTQTSIGVLPPIIKDDLNEDNVSWRTSLSWKPNPDAMVYATISKGYKAGSFSLLPAVFAVQLEPARQESVMAYEAGFKLTAFDRRVQISGAGFYYDYTDKQITGNVFIPPPLGFYLTKLQNVPKSRVYGAELEATLRPFGGLVLTGGVTYVNSRIKENPDPAIDAYGAPTSFVGDPFPNTPRWQGVVDAQYNIPVGRTEMFVGASVTARSKTDATVGNSPGGTNFVILRYSLLDLRAGIQAADGSWRAQVWGRNVTNKYYRIGNFLQIDSIVDITGMPATYGVTLSYRFR